MSSNENQQYAECPNCNAPADRLRTNRPKYFHCDLCDISWGDAESISHEEAVTQFWSAHTLTPKS